MPVIMNSETFVLDNGGYTMKAGFSNHSSPRRIPNCIMKAKSEKRRAFVGDQIEECRDLSSLFYMLPFQKGYLVNWNQEKKIWDYLWGEECFNLETRETNLIFTQPYFNFSSIDEGLNELFFEEYAFKRVLRTHSGDLAAYENRRSSSPGVHCCLVIDSGYSFTHIIPYVNGYRVREAVLRINIGGKLLTNHLKEIVSYRQLHVLDETYVMNACKEDCCYVSLNFAEDLADSSGRKRGKKSTIARDYILPDFSNLRRGVMKPLEESTGRSKDENEQIIRMNNERFTIPEILFSPSDVGVHQMGIGEAAVHSVNLCSETARPWLFKNVILIGGNAKFPNMKERLEREIREWAPDILDVKVNVPEDPVSYAWHGGTALAQDPCFPKICVSRKEYLEKGHHNVCEERYYL